MCVSACLLFARARAWWSGTTLLRTAGHRKERRPAGRTHARTHATHATQAARTFRASPSPTVIRGPTRGRSPVAGRPRRRNGVPIVCLERRRGGIPNSGVYGGGGRQRPRTEGCRRGGRARSAAASECRGDRECTWENEDLPTYRDVHRRAAMIQRARRRQDGRAGDSSSTQTLRQAWPRVRAEAAMCVRDVDVQCVLQFTLVNAAGCALHRRTSRAIHRLELFAISPFFPEEGGRSDFFFESYLPFQVSICLASRERST